MRTAVIAIFSAAVAFSACMTDHWAEVEQKNAEIIQRNEQRQQFVESAASGILQQKLSQGTFFAGPHLRGIPNGDRITFARIDSLHTQPYGNGAYSVSAGVIFGAARGNGAEARVDYVIDCTVPQQEVLYGEPYIPSLPGDGKYYSAETVMKESTTAKVKSPRVRSAIADRSIYAGMPETALVASWGHAREINETVVRGRSHKQYVYATGDLVYVDDGIVTAWQRTHVQK